MSDNVSMFTLAPIGSFLINFDKAITEGQLEAVSGIVALMNEPLVACAILYLGFEGWKIASGDLNRINSLTFTFAKIALIFYVCTNLTVFNQWVIQLWEHGFPDEITKAVNLSTHETSSINGVAGGIDKIWYAMWLRTAHIWTQAGWTDIASRLIATIMLIVGAIGLILIGGVYLIARFLFAVVVVFGPICIACAMFQTTRPVFERWIGKGISLIVLQVAAVITMQIVLSGTSTWAHDNSIFSSGSLPMMIQNEVSMVVWILLGAFAIYSLPPLAYSLGTGITISFAPIAAAAMAAAHFAPAIGSSHGSGSNGGSNDTSALNSPSSSPSDLDLSQARLLNASSSNDVSFLSGGENSGYLGNESSQFLSSPPPPLPPPPISLPPPT